MFNKILANLPYHPALIDHLGFYARRMREESSIRRLGFVFVALALVVQIYAVAAPPHLTSANSNNDLITGGFGSRQTAVNDCQSNLAGYGTILSNYGISCDNVALAPTVSLRSTDYNHQLFSMGRLPYGKAGETPVTVGSATYYWRYLWSWDTYAYSTYSALQVTNSAGTTFFILYNCGNLVSIGLPRAPSLTLTKTTGPGFPTAGSVVKPGDIIDYRIYFNNNGGTATNVHLVDNIPADTSFVWQGTSAATSYAYHSTPSVAIPGQPPSLWADWTWSTMPAGAQNYYTDMKVRVNSGVANGTRICNTAFIQSTQTPLLASNQVCHTVQQTPPPTPITPATPTCPYDTSVPVTSSECKPCVSSQTQTDIASCLTFSKSAANLTENVQDANGTTAQPGDTIQYTLSVKNTAKATAKNFVIQENLSDVLDYAGISNANGGKLDSNDILSWPAVNIAPDQTVEETFTVKVKGPIPTTPPSTSDPGHFDHVMTNVYGNTINIKLPMPTAQTAAQVTTNLPNTGPGSSLVIAVAITAVVGYFFARARLLAREADIVRKELSGAGA